MGRRLGQLSQKLTMTQVMASYLLFLLAGALVGSLTGWLPSGRDILLQGVYLWAVCILTNTLLARLFKVTINRLSTTITALILTLVTGPATVFPTQGGISLAALIFPTLAGLLAVTSKYFLAPGARHIFNPAAMGMVGAAWLTGQPASWWVGSDFLIPFVLLGGIYTTEKIHRWHLVASFLLTYLGGIFLLESLSDGLSTPVTTLTVLVHSPLLFFATVMVVEPLTSPTTRRARMVYGALVGLLALVYQRLGQAMGLELALMTGNLFAYLLQPRRMITLVLQNRQALTKKVTSFYFVPFRPLQFTPGQFLELTLPHFQPDSRGAKRNFSIASSPTERPVMITTKFSSPSSSFKSALAKLRPGQEMTARPVSGDFTLPEDRRIPCVFIAGGIGITPFRSMIKFLLDSGQSQPITLFYSARTPEEVIFRDIFTAATEAFGLKAVYTLIESPPKGWRGHRGFIDAALIRHEVPDWRHRLFYVSGPEPMVEAFEKLLKKMGLPSSQVKRDYFPGYPETHQPGGQPSPP